MKKTFSLVLALLMALSLAAPASAAELSTKRQFTDEISISADGIVGRTLEGKGGIATTAPVTLRVESKLDNVRSTLSLYVGFHTAGIGDPIVALSEGESYVLTEPGEYSIQYGYIKTWENANAGLPLPGQGAIGSVGMTSNSFTYPLEVGTVALSSEQTSIPTPKSFRDVAAGRWSHSAIMEMVGLGIFAGTKAPDANGIGSFDPEGTMTRAQFIAVVTRQLYADTLATMTAGKYWYSNNYKTALNNGIITESEFPVNSLEDPITRQEMAMIMVRAALKQDKTLPALVPTDRIADYADIAPYYQAQVRLAFSMGLVAGHDAKGTFGPKETLTREQGAMVVYRLVNKDSRVKVETEPNEPIGSLAAGAIVIYEGQTRRNRIAQAGDLFIKADGTKIILKIGPSGVLGEGQGVAPDLGLIDSNNKEVQHGKTVRINSKDFTVTRDSTGSLLNNQEYCVNKYTGEGHWEDEWQAIADYIGTPPRDGVYDNERYLEDGVGIWEWFAPDKVWQCIPSRWF